MIKPQMEAHPDSLAFQRSTGNTDFLVSVLLVLHPNTCSALHAFDPFISDFLRVRCTDK